MGGLLAAAGQMASDPAMQPIINSMMGSIMGGGAGRAGGARAGGGGPDLGGLLGALLGGGGGPGGPGGAPPPPTMSALRDALPPSVAAEWADAIARDERAMAASASRPQPQLSEAYLAGAPVAGRGSAAAALLGGG